MLKVIPSHALIVTVGPNAVSREDYVSKHFEQHEIVNARRICFDLVGEEDRPDLNSIVFGELRRRVSLKLNLGQRVVIDAPNLRREDRLSLARLANENGIAVFYLLCDPAGADDNAMQRFKATEKDLMRGDGIAEVIDWRVHEPHPIRRQKPDIDELRQRWSGLTVIGDVHGMYQSLLSALAWARSRNHYVMFIGDVIDYGPDTLEVADEVYRIVTRGEGELILGNHERKIARFLSQTERGRYGRLSDGNKVTTQALDELGTMARARWEGRFRGLVAHASHCRQIGQFVFAHAGVHPDYWDGTATIKEVETWALFGEFDATEADQRPARKYTWTESIPDGRFVVVGHDIRSTERPLRAVNEKGGTSIFLDTGCGKGGHLSSVDLRITENGLRLENFNIY